MLQTLCRSLYVSISRHLNAWPTISEEARNSLQNLDRVDNVTKRLWLLKKSPIFVTLIICKWRSGKHTEENTRSWEYAGGISLNSASKWMKFSCNNRGLTWRWQLFGFSCTVQNHCTRKHGYKSTENRDNVTGTLTSPVLRRQKTD